MKKSAIIAAAIASLMAGSAAADSTVYGIAHASLTSYDTADMWKVDSNGSRLGFKGSEDLGNGMKAIFQMEMAYDLTDGQGVTGANDGAKHKPSARNSFVGLTGDFGTAVIGRHDTPAKAAFYAAGNEHLGDSIVDLNGSFGMNETRASNAIAYISNDMNGLSFAAAIVPGETATDNGLADSTSVGVMYKSGAIKFGLGVDSFASDDTMTTVGGSYNMDDLTVGVQYSSEENAGVDSTALAIVGKFAMDKNALIASIGTSEVGATDGSVMNVAYTIGMSKKTTAYVAYSSREAGTQKGEDDLMSFGLMTKF
ncbi:MAG: porin [Gammaproteobacteria bacterium]|nr:porin [Gammaproteobacteria bacterium]